MEWIDDYWLQVAAYAGAIEQTLGVTTDRAVIITVTATTAQEFSIDRTQLDKHWEQWKIRVGQFWSQHGALAN
jgi:CRISPR/Cas system-associated exonuclease Cas4 (RecB family)